MSTTIAVDPKKSASAKKAWETIRAKRAAAGLPAPVADPPPPTVQPEIPDVDPPAEWKPVPYTPGAYLTVGRESFGLALAMAAKLTGGKQAMPILGATHLAAKDGVLVVRATNLDTEVVVRFNVVADLAPSTVTAGRLATLIAGQGATVTLSARGKQVSVEANGRTFQVTQPAEANEMPAPFDADNADETTGYLSGANAHLHAPTFIRDMRYAMSAVCKDETRYNMGGVHVDDGRIVSTDTHRLHLVTAPYLRNIPATTLRLDTLEAVLHAAKALGEGSIALTVGPVFVTFRLVVDGAEVTIRGRKVEGQFPPYQAVIPKKSTSVFSIDAEHVSEALALVAKLSTGQRIRGVRLTFGSTAGEVLGIEATGADSFTELVPFQRVIGPDVVAGFNAPYLIDALRGAIGNVTVRTIDDCSPIVVEAGPRLAVVMPMKL